MGALNETTARGAAAPPTARRYVPGREYLPVGIFGNSGAAVAEGQLVLNPFVIHERQRFDSIGCRLFGAGSAGALLRLGLYADADERERPRQLIVDAGTIDATSSGTVQRLPIDVVLNPGIVWVAWAPQGAATTRPQPAGSGRYLTDGPGVWACNPFDHGYAFPTIAAGVTGALPEQFEGTATFHTAGRIALRAAGSN